MRPEINLARYMSALTSAQNDVRLVELGGVRHHEAVEQLAATIYSVKLSEPPQALHDCQRRGVVKRPEAAPSQKRRPLRHEVVGQD